MASIKLVLYTQKTNKDGSHPFILQIIHNRKVRRISLSHSLQLKDWDAKNQKIKRSVTNYDDLTAMLKKKEAEAQQALLNLEFEKKDFTLDELVNKIVGFKEKTTFNDYMQIQIDSQLKANKVGNANSYKWALNALNNFTKKRKVSFADFNYKFLKQFEETHLSKESNTIGGFNVYMRAIRAVYNKAIKENLVSPEKYPFNDYKIKGVQTKKRAISKEEMRKIILLKLPEYTPLWHARNYFLFSFYTIGMNWIDMANLQRKNIIDGRIEYKRSKTGKELSIRINENIQDILNIYITNGGKDDYVFPIQKPKESLSRTREYIKEQLKDFNSSLKQIAELAKIDKKVTSYVARHSWATIANFSGTATGIISQGLGHSDIKTTQTYLAEFDNSEIDNVNANIL